MTISKKIVLSLLAGFATAGSLHAMDPEALNADYLRAAECGQFDNMWQHHMEGGADPRAVDCIGETVLHKAARWNNVQVVTRLLRLFPDLVNVSTREGKTPLHIAATFNYPEIVRLLINAGANTRATTETGVLPIDEACALPVSTEAIPFIVTASGPTSEAVRAVVMRECVGVSVQRPVLDLLREREGQPRRRKRMRTDANEGGPAKKKRKR